MTPNTTIPHHSHSSTAATISPTADAASIMTAQYPNMVSCHLCGNSLIRNPSKLPIIVEPQRPIALIQVDIFLLFSCLVVWLFSCLFSCFVVCLLFCCLCCHLVGFAFVSYARQSKLPLLSLIGNVGSNDYPQSEGKTNNRTTKQPKTQPNNQTTRQPNT